MFRPRWLLLVALLGTIGYLAWRWRQGAAATVSPPPAPPAPTPAPAPVPAGEAAPTPSGPRRITTRVHRGAPPAAPLRPALAAPRTPEEPPPPPSEPPATHEQTLAPLSAEEAVAAPAEPEPPATHEQTLAPLSAEEAVAAPLGAAAEPSEPVNINTAGSQALIDLPGIGPALAARIIAHREQHGPFATIDELVDIPGIGPTSINEFRHLVTV
jgi:competence protein ComEA